MKTTTNTIAEATKEELIRLLKRSGVELSDKLKSPTDTKKIKKSEKKASPVKIQEDGSHELYHKYVLGEVQRNYPDQYGC